MDVEFVIPNRDDELRCVSSTQYYVNDISSSRELNEVFLSFRDQLTEEGIDYIYKNFDNYYSILKNFAELSPDVRLDCYEILIQASNLLLNELVSLLEENSPEALERYRFKYRNLFKMSVYLMCQLNNAFEREILKPTPVVTGTKKRKNTKRKKTTGDGEIDLSEKRMEFLRYISEIFKLPLSKLWDPPHIEQDLLNLVIESSFGLLENPEVVHDLQIVDDLIQFLGYLLKTYKTSLVYCVKIVQLVQQCSYCVPVLSSAVHQFVTKYDAGSLVANIFDEISCNDLVGTERLHQLSQFVLELTEKCTDKVQASIDHLLTCLNEESHIMRNCVLSVIGELMLNISQLEQVPDDVIAIRDNLLDKLYDHLFDITGFVRSKAVQIVTHLFEETAMPLCHQLRFLDRTSGRLMDKTSTVRKSAVNFLKIFVVVNPYAVQISVEELKTNYEKECVTLKDLLAQVFNKSVKPTAIHFDSSDEDSEDEGVKKDTVENGAKSGKEDGEKEVEVEDALNTSLSQEDRAEALKVKITKQRVLVDYLELTLRSAECIIDSIPILCDLLKSATITDTMEAIDFFVSAFETGLKDSVVGIKMMMQLIFSKEQSIRNAVVAAYKKLYLVADNKDDQSASRIAGNLVKLLKGASDNEVFAIEEFVKEFVKSGDISDAVLNVLWDIYMMKSPENTEMESVSSVTLLSMAASVNNGIILRKIDLLVSVGLGPRANRDFQLARETCSALLKIDNFEKGEGYVKTPFRLNESHVLFTKIANLLVNGVVEHKDNMWVPMCEKAIGVLFRLSNCPEKMAVTILKRIAEMIFNNSRADVSMHQTQVKKQDLVNMMFCRFLFLSGHIAYWFTLYIETDVFNELKRRVQLKSSKKNSKHNDLKISRAKRKSCLSSVNSSPSDSVNKSKDELSDNDNAEDDFFLEEFIHRICDEEVLNEDNLLGVVFPVVLKSCMWSLKHCDARVCAPASLSLAKFMSVNEKVCEDNMQLLVTIMEKFPDPAVRSNIIIALSDLLIRFPNVVQPWVSRIYLRLRDEVHSVRKMALITLTHLILHDMIKAKSQISEIAICIVDSEDISKIAKFLFTELARKQNALYNILPDIISVLSDDSSELTDENYQIIIRHIFQFIDKDRQIETLVAKLCHRFRDASSVSHQRKIAFSLSLLTFNDKCFTKLVENKTCFNKKLDDEVVVSYFKEVLVNAKKDNPKIESDIVQFMNELNL